MTTEEEILKNQILVNVSIESMVAKTKLRKLQHLDSLTIKDALESNSKFSELSQLKDARLNALMKWTSVLIIRDEVKQIAAKLNGYTIKIPKIMDV